MRVSDASAGILVVSAAFLGCVAPVYTDALQSMKRFKSLAAVEVCGSAVRFLAMLATMPFRALAGYFAGQAALPAFRIAGSVIALRRDLSVPAEPYWNRETVRRVALTVSAAVVYTGYDEAGTDVSVEIRRRTADIYIPRDATFGHGAWTEVDPPQNNDVVTMADGARYAVRSVQEYPNSWLLKGRQTA